MSRAEGPPLCSLLIRPVPRLHNQGAQWYNLICERVTRHLILVQSDGR